MLICIYPFLALTRRVDTNILVVEGWMDFYALRAAAEELKRGPYQHVITTGGPLVGNHGTNLDYSTVAKNGSNWLADAGVPARLIQVAPCTATDKDRTYGSAVALRDWFRSEGLEMHSLNVITEDAHARRTQLLFKKAFGRDVDVGIISVPSPDFDG
jgi:hypothetical protein